MKFDDGQAYHRQSRNFHMALSKPSGMLRLLHMLQAAWNITEPVQLMVHVDLAERARLHEDHRRMLEAFVAKDVDALLAVSAEHNGRLNTVVRALPTDTGLIVDD